MIEGLELPRKGHRSFAEFLIHFVVEKSDKMLTMETID